jgi:UDP-2,3-diacylglucosamine pyrophosphatase LpxH
MSKRKLDIVVISDIHLGTYGCQAEELVQYLKGIQPGTLVLNGDIIDIWQFSKRYWPRAHMQVLKEIVKIAAREIPVYYLTGNHDELLRKFPGFSLGNFHLQDQLVLEVQGKQQWFFHGDVFDASLEYARWLAKLGAVGYDLLIMINGLVNWGLTKLGREKMSFSKKIKNSVKTAVSYISDFEQTAANHAIERGYDYVICGHIHQPQIKYLHTDKGDVTYLNSGDWVENLTALEYQEGQWSIYTFEPEKKDKKIPANSPNETVLPPVVLDGELSEEAGSDVGLPTQTLNSLPGSKPVKFSL